jgi:hypothetical protein
MKVNHKMLNLSSRAARWQHGNIRDLTDLHLPSDDDDKVHDVPRVSQVAPLVEDKSKAEYLQRGLHSEDAEKVRLSDFLQKIQCELVLAQRFKAFCKFLREKEKNKNFQFQTKGFA